MKEVEESTGKTLNAVMRYVDTDAVGNAWQEWHFLAREITDAQRDTMSSIPVLHIRRGPDGGWCLYYGEQDIPWSRGTFSTPENARLYATKWGIPTDGPE